MLLSEGQMSDYKGAALMFASLPKAKTELSGFPCVGGRLNITPPWP